MERLWNKRLKRIGHAIDAFFTYPIILELGIEKDKQQEIDLNENEWSLKKILMRLILYPFCLFLIGLGIIMCRNGNWRLWDWFIGFCSIYAGLMLLYIDIKVIVQYHKAKKQTTTK